MQMQKQKLNTAIALAVLLTLNIGGCATPTLPEAVTFTTEADATWVKNYDNELLQKQNRSISQHSGGFESRLILWQQLNCLRRVYVAEARAADQLAKKSDIPLSNAISSTQADPSWQLARNSCR